MFDIISSKSISFSEEWYKGKLDKSLVIYLNPFTYIYFRDKTESISNVTGIRYDGMFMSSVLKLFGIRIKERESFDMTSLAPKIFERCESLQKRVFVLGGAPGDPEKFMDNIKSSYPNLKFCGHQHGYFDVDEDVIDEIVNCKPDLVIVGLGGKKQEEFGNKLYGLYECAVFTCGAFISQTTKKQQYYPSYINKFHLRWLYRMVNEKGIFSRVLKNYPKFIFVIAKDYINFKVKR